MAIIPDIIDGFLVLIIGGVGYLIGHDKGESKGRTETSEFMYKNAYTEGYDDAKSHKRRKVSDEEYDEEGYLLEK